jgi:serine/threonine protein kinase
MTPRDSRDVLDGEHCTYGNTADTPYEYIENLGGGSHGIVDSVRCTSGLYSGKILARKEIAVGSRLEFPRIEEEIRIIKRLQHQHIIRICDSYSVPKKIAILMLPVARLI